MTIAQPTNQKGYARHFLKHVFAKLGETRQAMQATDYNVLAEKIGLTPPQTIAALAALKRENLISLDPTSQAITLTPDGVLKGDYLKYRQEWVLLSDPLPETRDEIQLEIRHYAQEQQTNSPNSPEWQQIDARLGNLKYLDSAMRPITFHDINVSRSVVGAINTGEVEKIDVAIDRIKMAGEAEIADSLKQFTAAVLESKELKPNAKEEVIEQLSFLTDQTLASQDQRKPAMARSLMGNISTAVSISNGLATLWQHLHPLLSKII